MQAQLSELQKMFFFLTSEAVNVNKKVEQYTGVSFVDSRGFRKSRCIKGRINKKRSHRRNNLKTSLTYHTRTQNEKNIKNFSNKVLSYNEVKLLSRGLKFIPTPPVPTSNKSLLKDFSFPRTMRLRYIFADKRKTLAHPFHVKSTWQPPIQN